MTTALYVTSDNHKWNKTPVFHTYR